MATGRISDEAVLSKTGRNRADWFARLDAAGAATMGHREIVACVGAEGVGPWWQQMIAVAYEQSRGLREKHEKPSGFEISRSRTIAAPANALFRAFSEARIRTRWLPAAGLAIRKTTPGRAVRIAWTGGSSVEVRLYPKAPDRTQVTVQHGKLKDAEAGKEMKAFWGEKLERLEEIAGRLK